MGVDFISTIHAAWRRVPVSRRLELHFLIQRNRYLRCWLFPEVELIRKELARPGLWNRPADASATIGKSERVVEIPWVISRALPARRILDIGTAWANPVYLGALKRLSREAEVVGVDLARRRVSAIRVVSADVRRMPWEDGKFDVVICVSTLEHIGMDNQAYGWKSERAERQDVPALAEMGRVLNRKGRLLVTVPFGESGEFGWFRQYNMTEWASVVDAAGLRIAEYSIYEHTRSGWQLARRALTPRHYGKGGTQFASSVLCGVLTH